MAALLLAAGSGSRFGSDKLMHALPDGRPMAVASALRMREGLPEARCVAVVRSGHTLLADALGAAGFDVVFSAEAHLGMGHSLAAGVRACPQGAGFVVALADMPFIEPATMAAVGEALHAGASIAAPSFEGRRGHPVGFAAMHGPALAALKGDAGARELLRAHADSIVLVPVDDAGVLRDVDTPADLAR